MAKMTEDSSSVPAAHRFKTVLAIRKNTSRASDIELALRPQCSNFRVVDANNSGPGSPHFILSGKLAVRVQQATSPSDDMDTLSASDKKENTRSFDDQLAIFCRSFQLSVILFIVPSQSEQQELLEDVDSSFHRAQRIVNRIGREDKNKTSRVFLVPSSRAALSTLEDMLETHNNRLEQQEVFASTVRQLFLPEPSTGIISNECSAVASAHVAEVLRIWEGRFDLSPGEVDVLMSVLGSAGNMVDAKMLENVPVEEKTLRALQSFFGLDIRASDLSCVDVNQQSQQPAILEDGNGNGNGDGLEDTAPFMEESTAFPTYNDTIPFGAQYSQYGTDGFLSSSSSVVPLQVQVSVPPTSQRSSQRPPQNFNSFLSQCPVNFAPPTEAPEQKSLLYQNSMPAQNFPPPPQHSMSREPINLGQPSEPNRLVNNVTSSPLMNGTRTYVPQLQPMHSRMIRGMRSTTGVSRAPFLTASTNGVRRQPPSRPSMGYSSHQERF